MTVGLITASVLLMGAGPAPGVQVSEVTREGKTFIALTSKHLDVLVAPHSGGQMTSLVYRPRGVQMGNRGSLDWGLWSDHDLKQGHPGELMRAVYDAHVDPADRQGHVTVRLSRLARGGWRKEIKPTLKDMLYEKSYTILPTAPVIRMRVRITNRSTEAKLVDYWSQSIAQIGARTERNYYFRPSTAGISVTSSDAYTVQRQFVTDPTAGWMAAINRPRRLGMVYLVDYNWLERFYNCTGAFTQEFMYERLPLPPGRSWATGIALRVIEGFDSVAHASERVVVGIELDRKAQQLHVTGRFCAFDRPIGKVRVAVALRDPATQFEVKGVPYAVPTLGLDTQSHTWPFELTDSGTMVLAVAVFSDAGVDRFELPVSLFGDFGTPYSRAAPARRMRFEKPSDLGKVWAAAKASPRGLLQLGANMFGERWRLAEVAKSLGMAYHLSMYRPAASWRNASLHPFPVSHAELFAHNVVVLADGDARALRSYGCEMMRDYVATGGGVLLLGGMNSFGKGSLVGSSLEAIVPVDTRGVWDLCQSANPVPKPTPGAPVWLRKLPWSDRPRVSWFQQTRAKPGTTTYLSVDDQPLLVTRQVGKGRVAALCATVFTDAQAVRPARTPELQDWSGYTELMKHLLLWLQGKSP